MPGYVIHLAVAEKQLENGKIKNRDEFIKGVLAPDLLKKKGYDSHFGYSSAPDFKKFLEAHKDMSDYNKGYFLHLLTDYLFYNKLISEWKPEIYEDFDILNEKLIASYSLKIPEQIKDVVQYKNGELTVLNMDDVFSFINAFSEIPLEKYYKMDKDNDEVEV